MEIEAKIFKKKIQKRQDLSKIEPEPKKQVKKSAMNLSPDLELQSEQVIDQALAAETQLRKVFNEKMQQLKSGELYTITSGPNKTSVVGETYITIQWSPVYKDLNPSHPPVNVIVQKTYSGAQGGQFTGYEIGICQTYLTKTGETGLGWNGRFQLNSGYQVKLNEDAIQNCGPKFIESINSLCKVLFPKVLGKEGFNQNIIKKTKKSDTKKDVVEICEEEIQEECEEDQDDS